MAELRILNLNKCFNKGTSTEIYALNNINITVSRGEFLIIVGPNGSGKSTLLNSVAGEISYEGNILYEDTVELSEMKSYEISRFIARVYQDPEKGIIPNASVAENIAISCIRGKRPRWTKRAVSKEWLETIEEELSTLGVGLEKKLNEIALNLSGGQKQILAIFMIMKSNPAILLLDEHVASLDEKNSNICMELTNKFVTEANITTLMVTHNLSHASSYGDRLIIMRDGRINNTYERINNEQIPLNKIVGWLGYW